MSSRSSCRSSPALRPEFLIAPDRRQRRGPRCPGTAYRANVARILDELVARVGAARILVVTIPDYTVTPAGADYGDPATQSAAIRRNNAINTELAEARGIAVVDIYDISLRAADDRTLVATDGLHPSGAQYARWVDRIQPAWRHSWIADDPAGGAGRLGLAPAVTSSQASRREALPHSTQPLVSALTLASNDFVHLHTHSEFSLLDGLGRITDLVDEASAKGFDSLALTDHGALYGAVAFYQAAPDKGIKPIIGVETYVARRSMTDKEGKADAQPFHLDPPRDELDRLPEPVPARHRRPHRRLLLQAAHRPGAPRASTARA